MQRQTSRILSLVACTMALVGCAADAATSHEQLSLDVGGAGVPCDQQLEPGPECNTPPSGPPSSGVQDADTVDTFGPEHLDQAFTFTVGGFALTSSNGFYYKPTKCERKEPGTVVLTTYNEVVFPITIVYPAWGLYMSHPPEFQEVKVHDALGRACGLKADTVAGRLIDAGRVHVTVETRAGSFAVGHADISFGSVSAEFNLIRADDIILTFEPSSPSCSVANWNVGGVFYYARRQLRIPASNAPSTVELRAHCSAGAPVL